MNTFTALLVFLTLFFPSALKADVQISEKYQTSGFMGIGATNGETVQKIKGSDSSIDSSQNFSGPMMALMGGTAGPKRKIDLIRLDEGKRWILNPENRTYIEAPLAPHPSKPPNMDHIPVQLKGTSFRMTPSKIRKTIHGFKTRLYNATFTMKLENTTNKQISTFKVKLKLWVAPWTLTLRKAHREIEAFNSLYLRKTGGQSAQIGAQPLGLEMLKSMTHYNGETGTALTKGIAEFRKKMSELPGFPIEMESDWYTSFPRQKSQKASAPGSLDVSQLPAGIPAATKNLLQGLVQAANPNGTSPLMSMKTVVSSIKLTPIAGNNFSIPADYRKK